MVDLRIAHYPGTPMVDSSEELRGKVEAELLPKIIEGLSTTQTSERLQESAHEPGPSDVVLRGSLDEVNERYYENMWTDGMPVIPPTVERIERFLRYTD